MAVVEVNFRGATQVKAAEAIEDMIYQVNVEAGRAGMTFLRWNDSPQRVGIPTKIYVVIGGSLEEIEGTSVYEPEIKDVSVALDETMLFGLEAAGNMGIETVVNGIKENGLLVVVTEHDEETIKKYLPKAENRYQYALVKGKVPFAGLWRPLDPSERTHIKVLGAIARYYPEVFTHEEAKAAIPEEFVEAFEDGYENAIHGKMAETGPPPERPKWPSWKELSKYANVIPAVEVSGKNPHYQKGTTKTDIPVIDNTKCTKCALCWINCPDGCLARTPDGYYKVEEEYCSGCGICANVCPPECITMVNLIDYKEGKIQFEGGKR